MEQWHYYYAGAYGDLATNAPINSVIETPDLSKPILVSGNYSQLGTNAYLVDLSFNYTGLEFERFAFMVKSGTCGNDTMVATATLGDNPVPLPPSALLLGTGLVGLVGLGWRRSRQSS